MNELDWKGKRIVIIGAARQGLALAEYAVAKGAQVVLTDARSADQLADAQQRLEALPVEWALGGHPKSLLKNTDYLAPSGGVPSDLPLIVEARRKGILVTNDSQLFLEACPATTIGITGSSGKTTTTTLVGRMLRHMDRATVWIGGNIGHPLISDLDQMKAGDLAVMELSSFQLEWMTRSPQVAVLLNLAPNHLDRHKTMAEYAAAKAHIFDYQSESDTAVVGREDLGAWALASRVQGRLLSFGRDELKDGHYGTFVRGRQIWLRDEETELPLLPISSIELLGEHNLLNVLAACAIASTVGANPEAMQAGVEGFRGAPHRLEWVATVNGADWYNDSIATSPQRTMAALNAFEKPIVLLLGGRDKGLPWGELAKAAKGRCRGVVLFGEAAGMLRPTFNQAGLDTAQAEDLAGAVKAAAGLAQAGDVVLLSPGATSYDQYQDFEERGQRFRELVGAL